MDCLDKNIKALIFSFCDKCKVCSGPYLKSDPRPFSWYCAGGVSDWCDRLKNTCEECSLERTMVVPNLGPMCTWCYDLELRTCFECELT